MLSTVNPRAFAMSDQELLIASPKGRAVNAIREMIERGALRRGDRLPAEGALAARFNVRE